MDLSESVKLKELPDFSTATNLTELKLSQCSSLIELPSSIVNAINLQTLILGKCSSLVELPSSIGNLHNLDYLCLLSCSKLETLPVNINLKSLEELDLCGCSMLKSFPEISTNIKRLYLLGTSIEEVPSSFSTWSRLEELHMPYCENLKEFHQGALQFINGLEVRDKGIQEFGTWLKDCSRLYSLDVNGCKELISLPKLPKSITQIDARNCESLERLDFCNRGPYFDLNFSNCFKLNKEARDSIIQASNNDGVTILPGGEIPMYFTYRANGGDSLLVKLNERSFPSSVRFKACVLLVTKNDVEAAGEIHLHINCVTMDNNDVMLYGLKPGYIREPLKEHLYIFEFEANNVTSTELCFKSYSNSDKWDKKEFGITEIVSSRLW